MFSEVFYLNFVHVTGTRTLRTFFPPFFKSKMTLQTSCNGPTNTRHGNYDCIGVEEATIIGTTFGTSSKVGVKKRSTTHFIYVVKARLLSRSPRYYAKPHVVRIN